MDDQNVQILGYAIVLSRGEFKIFAQKLIDKGFVKDGETFYDLAERVEEWFNSKNLIMHWDHDQDRDSAKFLITGKNIISRTARSTQGDTISVDMDFLQPSPKLISFAKILPEKEITLQLYGYMSYY